MYTALVFGFYLTFFCILPPIIILPQGSLTSLPLFLTRVSVDFISVLCRAFLTHLPL